MKYENLQIVNDSNTIQPSFPQVAKISWSIMWRYMAFGLFFMVFLSLGYHFQINQIIEFSNLLKSLQSVSSKLGYTQALTLYSHQIMLLSLIRTIVGFVVTFVVFIYVSRLRYIDFHINVEGPLSLLNPSLKGILLVSWAFYWRILSLMIVLFAVSLVFVRPEWWISSFVYVMSGYLLLFFIVMLFVLKRIINKPFGGYRLVATKK
jgi:hypothetical protein